MGSSYGDAFLFDRVLNVFFYTSNSDKLLQARLLFSRSGYDLRHYRSAHEPYDEDYSLGTRALLAKAVRQVADEFRRASVFFVEDTSLRIDALSEDADYPGLSVKEWFQSTTFEQLDTQLKNLGNCRRATVKSDIALSLPTLSRPIFFHGETLGVVADKPPSFEPSFQYPWLTPNTFNGWFIPDGSDKTLGEMPFEESIPYDFRAKSIVGLLRRIEEINAALNLRASLYTVRRPTVDVSPQPSFLLEDRSILIVVGMKCSGKTTFSDHVVASQSVAVFEASSVLRDLAKPDGNDGLTEEEAVSYLKNNGPDIVARRICDYIDRISSDLTIITGFRTVEELSLTLERFPRARVILVEADETIRFERHIRRGRNSNVKTFTQFKEMDEGQRRFGLMRVAHELADYSIRNEGTIESYGQKIDDILGTVRSGSLPFSSRRGPEAGELYRCLAALNHLSRLATCDEIAEATGLFGAPIRRYNTNRALKNAPEFASRIEKRGELLSYAITPEGVDLLKLLESRQAVNLRTGL